MPAGLSGRMKTKEAAEVSGTDVRRKYDLWHVGL